MTCPTPETHAPEPKAPPGWGDVFVVLAVVLLPAVHSGFATIVWPDTVLPRPPHAYFYTSLLAMLAGWAALVFHLIARSGRPVADFGLARPRAVDVVWAVALFGGFGWAAGRTAGLFDYTPEVGYPAPPRGGEFALALVGCLAIGFTEELVWRGYLLTRVEALTGSAWQAVALTSLLFGLAHLYQGVGGVVNTGLVGLMCGGAFVATRRLAAVALAHGVYDLMVMT